MSMPSEFMQLIEKRLAELEARLDRVDLRLAGEVRKAFSIALVDLPFTLAKARAILELVIADIYRRERRDGKSRQLFGMIDELVTVPGLFTPKLVADVNYIRINGNLMVHAQEQASEIDERDVEAILLLTFNIVEWYLLRYRPARAGEPAEPPPDLPPPPNPYRGLDAFREEDSANFFGRDQDAADLAARVAARPLVALIGASGSGKSSLVFAGLVPHLRAPGGWRLASLRPHGDPTHELAKALAGLLYPDPLECATRTDDMAARLSAGQVRLGTLMELVLKGTPDRLLLCIDQFEEVFTQTPDPLVRAQFLDLLAAVLPEPGPVPPAWCLLFTLRADFLGRALEHPALAHALDRWPPKLLGPVDDPSDLRRIIGEPARRLDVTWQPLLIERLLRDLRAQPAGAAEESGISLPLLQFTLERLWERQDERTLTHLAYEELGGVQQALARHADGVVAALEPAQRERLPHIFTQLVCPGEGTEDTRQAATRDQIGETYWPLVTCLADQRLVVTGQNIQGHETVELIHEALLRHWPPLRQWVGEHRRFRLWQNRLRLELAEWEQHDRDAGALLRGARLAEAEDWLQGQVEALSEAERGYIRAGLEERERAIRARRWRQRWLIAGLTLGLVVVSGLGVFSYFQANDARQQALEANHNLGFVLLEKSQRYHDEENFVAARLYAYHALARLDPRRSGLEKAIGIIIGSPAPTPVFDSPSGVLQEGLVYCVSYSPSGRLIASGSGNGSIILWDAATGELRTTLVGHAGPITSLVFSPDDHTLAAGSGDGTIRLWTVATGQEAAILGGHTSPVDGLSFSPDGQTLVSGSRDKTIRLWDLPTHKQKAVLARLGGWITSVSFSPDGKLIAAGCVDRSIRLWNLTASDEPAVLTGHAGAVTSLRFAPDGQILASGSEDKTLRLWELSSGRERAKYEGHTKAISSVGYSPDGKMLASGSRDATIRLWQVETGREPMVLRGHTEQVTSVSFDPGGKTLASGGWDGMIRLWDLESGKEKAAPSGHTEWVTSVSFSPDGLTLASGARDKTVRLWDLISGQVKSVLTEHTNWVRSVSFSPDGRTLATGSRDNTVRLWDPASGKLRSVLTNHTDWITSLGFSPDSRILASGSNDRSIRLWEVDSGTEIAVLRGHQGPVKSLAFSPDGTTLATGSNDTTVRLWDVASATEKAVLREHTEPVTSIRFASDGKTLATGSADKSIRLWDLATQNEKRMLSGHTGKVYSLVFVPDGQTLISGSADGTIRLWELSSGHEKSVLRSHASPVTSLSISPDGQTLASASGEGSIQFWELATASEPRILSGHMDEVDALVFSPDGQTLASASKDHSIVFWNIATGTTPVRLSDHMDSLQTLTFLRDGQTLATWSQDQDLRLWEVTTGFAKPASALATDHVEHARFAPDGRTFAAATADGKIRLWQVENGRAGPALAGPRSAVTGMGFSLNGKRIAAAFDDHGIRVWEVSTGRLEKSLEGQAQRITSVSVSPDDQFLVAGYADGAIDFWKLTTEEQAVTLIGHTAAIESLVFSPHGRVLASGSDDGTIRLWNAATRKLTAVLTGHTGGISSLSFSPDGQTLASGSRDHTIRLWAQSLLFDARPIEEQVKNAEAQYHFQLRNLELQPHPAEHNLLGAVFKAPQWSDGHPYHWLAAATRGDPVAMRRLALSYERAGALRDAEFWYRRAADVGDPAARQHRDELRQRQPGSLQPLFDSP